MICYALWCGFWLYLRFEKKKQFFLHENYHNMFMKKHFINSNLKKFLWKTHTRGYALIKIIMDIPKENRNYLLKMCFANIIFSHADHFLRWKRNSTFQLQLTSANHWTCSICVEKTNFVHIAKQWNMIAC